MKLYGSLEVYITIRGYPIMNSLANSNYEAVYVCGPTIYQRPHIGNLRNYVVGHVLAQILDVPYHIGLTDISDQIVDMHERGAGALVTQYTKLFVEDLTALGVAGYTLHPVTERIEAILTVLSRLQAMDAITRKEADVRLLYDGREQYALWKIKDGVLTYPSPYGRGRPGWHVECVANVLTTGKSRILHGGGIDLRVYHHRHEAQLFTLLNHAVDWFHCQLLTVHGAKMSKRTGNTVHLPDVPIPALLRYFFLTTDYHKGLDYTPERFTQRVLELQRMVSVVLWAAAWDDLKLAHRVLPRQGLQFTGTRLHSLYSSMSTATAESRQLFAKAFLDYNHQYRLIPLSYERVRAQGELIRRYHAAKTQRAYAIADQIRAHLRAGGIQLIHDGIYNYYRPFIKLDRYLTHENPRIS